MASKNKDRGDRLRTLRENKGLEQKDVAEEIGVHFSHISKWESGAGISRKHLINLASVLETTIDYIETGKKKNMNGNSLVDDIPEPISKKAQQIKNRVEEKGIEYKDRAELIEVLQSRADTLSRELREFSLMIGMLKQSDD